MRVICLFILLDMVIESETRALWIYYRARDDLRNRIRMKGRRGQVPLSEHLLFYQE